MSPTTQRLLWSLGLFLLFTLMPIAEVWFLKRQGFDILAHLRVSFNEGKRRFFFEAFGVVAFIKAQPFFFLILFSRISDKVHDLTLESLRILLG